MLKSIYSLNNIINYLLIGNMENLLTEFNNRALTKSKHRLLSTQNK
jgi:hypothetical protein